MSLQNFRTYHLAVTFYRLAEKFRCNYPFKDQLIRASSSIPLNLAEGSAKPSKKDRAKFYYIALGSFRECQAVFELSGLDPSSELAAVSHQLGAHLYRLVEANDEEGRKKLGRSVLRTSTNRQPVQPKGVGK